ncbi:stage III sporulation protein AH [Pontibacillus halophilus JSM 076056 = DSM 19796]|uniref:Stage III sporulation protein AH n=2 Tax=Pontibacillus TaxID=289201 RepID=A0A0A5GCJ2_9BACI|nr:SpoIIIAH-like family protein [Pontibacillus halophilus]KGX90906.1 stage III sporulation protein AH [Pontibacillus halophilus JSM 076056 = DSM 19796]
MLKKQTVWLLTMLSLMIVLSVYYITSPNDNELAYIDENSDEEQSAQGDLQTEDGEALQTQGKDGEQQTVISEISSDELFTKIRMEMEDNRSRLKEELNDIVTSTEVSANEKNEAISQIRDIQELATKESVLEETILAQAEYPDVLVRAEEQMVYVTVKSAELTETQANSIMQMVRDEFGQIEVQVDFQPSEQ